ncbi:flagellar basal body L-ring protein FlgH [Lysobacter spongiicola]|uniref:Flagellar L-ring protein n=1 Tax=Lysobacter spongiicola DSM 21749 TaxID=1122188 RepID=A0A1T4RZK3_9GAMM|nr:flagellar L-ring protein precursor FlgH [Lysobacter spongiicola DSM 21749]
MKTVATLAVATILLTSGCASLVGDVRAFEPYAPVAPMYAGAMPGETAHAAAQVPTAIAAPPHSGGSIYASRAGGGARPLALFEDNKARNVGDLLTIVLVERTSSSTKAQTAVTKDSGFSMGAPVIAGVPVTYNGQSILQAEVEAGRDFSGAGDSSQSNRLDGEITVTVVRDLGNGNLLVSGQKQMRLNQGDELVQVQGIVRVADITPDNRITSDRVGNAQIAYGGRGTLARSNAMGWLGRFFNSAAFPY